MGTADGRIEQLGWPRLVVDYRSGTRHPDCARLHLTTPHGEPLLLEVETLGGAPLSMGAGYVGDPAWSHGRWMGRDWSESVTYDMTSPDVVGMLPFNVVDHVARATCEYLEAWRPPDIASGSQQYCRSGPVTASVGATNDFDCWEAALLPIRRAAPVTITQRRRVLPERVVAIRPQGRGGALGGVPAVPRIARDPGPVQLSTQLVHVRWFARWCTPAWKLLEEHLCSSPSTAVASAAASTAARRWQHLPSKAVGADGSQARHYWPPSAIIALPAPGSRRQYVRDAFRKAPF